MYLQSKKKGKNPTMAVCRYGSACNRKDCIYRHPQPRANMNAAPLDDADGSVENKVCMPFVAGFCTFGDKCYNCHPEPQQVKRLRAKYSRTKCRFGKNCKTSGCLYNHDDGPVGGWMAPTVADAMTDGQLPRSLLYQRTAQQQQRENGGPGKTVYANGPTYASHHAPGEGNWVEVQLDTVKIPDGVWRNHEDGAADAAFSIQDPVERFKYVNADRPLPLGQEGDIVIDLHFQSLKSVEEALDFALDFALWRHPCLSVWVVTGVGTHVPEGHQRKGGVLFEAVKESILHRLSMTAPYIVSQILVGVDGNGRPGALWIKKSLYR
ncbi:hypothetical protein FOZ60_004517 [Perkinsus olseni]|uniref:C3H1-type domain-containing protein n=1 Tax=Perkinsus olseni TaxID=32597 RepID=A0A7J6PNC7_PEROL|nr:hypothetical protein FOZ60_004517 [Perkinsus olseni]